MLPEERDAIAVLTRSSAYKHVLDAVAVSLQDFETELETGSSNEAILNAARNWRIGRRVLRILRDVPWQYREQIKQEVAEGSRDPRPLEMD